MAIASTGVHFLVGSTKKWFLKNLVSEMKASTLWLILPVAFCLGGDFVTAAENFRVESRIEGDSVYVEAEAVITAPHALIWTTLTDYDHLSNFIPGMKSSTLLRYEGETAVVEQHGSVSFLFFSLPVDVVVNSIEQKPNRIGIEVVRGSLDRLDGAYELLQKADGRWLVKWNGYVKPSLPLPRFITQPIIRKNIENQFAGMVTEIERRSLLN